MSAVAPASTCTCGSIGNTDGLRLCVPCHMYWRNDQRLTSVSKVLKTTWPIVADYSKADPAVLENARERGTTADDLFSAYVNGELRRIPAGTRADAVDLFFKVRLWWDAEGLQGQSQVILANESIAGTCDVLTSDGIFDLKSTYNLEPTYPLQVGLYALLHESMFGRLPQRLSIIWATKRFEKPQIVDLPLEETIADARTTLAMYTMVQRRMKR